MNSQGLNDDEVELDIDELPPDVLHKLNQFVKKHTGPHEHRSASGHATAPDSSRPKKNKPMSKTEQEAKIQEIRGKLHGLEGKPGAKSDSPEDCKFLCYKCCVAADRVKLRKHSPMRILARMKTHQKAKKTKAQLQSQVGCTIFPLTPFEANIRSNSIRKPHANSNSLSTLYDIHLQFIYLLFAMIPDQKPMISDH